MGARVAVLIVVLGGCRQILGFEEAGTASPDGPDDRKPDAATDAGIDAPPAPPFALTGLRFVSPCTSAHSMVAGHIACNCSSSVVTEIATIDGTPATHYIATIRIRGVLEGEVYNTGAAGPGGWYVGGATTDTAFAVYSITVSAPAQVYWLNHGPQHNYADAFDYTVDLPIDGGATVMFRTDCQDQKQWANADINNTPIVIPGVTTSPDPYDGQFARVDVLAVQ